MPSGEVIRSVIEYKLGSYAGIGAGTVI